MSSIPRAPGRPTWSAPVAAAPAADEVTVLEARGDVGDWVAAHRGELAGVLAGRGAVLVRGLGVAAAADVAAARDALGLAPVEPREPFAPRTDLGGGVHSAPEWAADREMCLHHEQSYAVEVPRTVLAGVLRAADTGGQTLLGDTRAVLDRLPAALVDRFRRQGWLLRRTFRPHFGLSREAAYGTADRAELDRRLAGARIGASWDDGVLRTVQRRPAVLRHPVTGADCWVNQLAFFSGWSVDRAEREVLLAAFGPDGIPFTTAHGDGEPLSEADFRTVLEAYDEVAVDVPVRTGDLLLLDNLLTAHGRRPYTGDRRLAVALADPVRLADCAPPDRIGTGPLSA